METTTTVGLFIAFTAGVLSFLSPCVLPLIPSYMSFITGLSLEEMGDQRRAAVTHALLFVSGFTLIFMALGATGIARRSPEEGGNPTSATRVPKMLWKRQHQ